MAIDRFVRWKTERPSFEDVQTVLEDFLGDVLVKLDVDGKHISAKIVGKPSFPFRRIHGDEFLAPMTEQHSERWLEVHVDKAYVDVITRITDEFTNVVAEGFAALCARRWRGKRDPVA